MTIDGGRINFGIGPDTSRTTAAEYSRKALGLKVRALGRSVFQESSEEIFKALTRTDRGKLMELAEHFQIRLTDDGAFVSMVEAIEITFQTRHDHSAVADGNAVQIMRDVDAAHRMQGVQQTAAVLLAEHYHSTRLTRKILQDKHLISEERVKFTELSPSQLDSVLLFLQKYHTCFH